MEILHKALRAHMSSASLVHAAVALVAQLILQYSRLILFYATRSDSSAAAGDSSSGGNFVRGSFIRDSFARTSLRLSSLRVDKQSTRMAVKGPQPQSTRKGPVLSGERAAVQNGTGSRLQSGPKQKQQQQQTHNNREASAELDDRDRQQTEEERLLQRSALATINHVERWLLPFLLDTVRPHFARRSRSYRRPKSSLRVDSAAAAGADPYGSNSEFGNSFEKAQTEEETELADAILEQIDQICDYFDAEHSGTTPASFDSTDSPSDTHSNLVVLHSRKDRELLPDKSDVREMPGRGSQSEHQIGVKEKTTPIRMSNEYLQTTFTTNAFVPQATKANAPRNTLQTEVLGQSFRSLDSSSSAKVGPRIEEDIIECEL